MTSSLRANERPSTSTSVGAAFEWLLTGNCDFITASGGFSFLPGPNFISVCWHALETRRRLCQISLASVNGAGGGGARAGDGDTRAYQDTSPQRGGRRQQHAKRDKLSQLSVCTTPVCTLSPHASAPRKRKVLRRLSLTRLFWQVPRIVTPR